MSVRPEVQEELRSLFRQGATPSRLIQHVAARHPDESRLNWLIVTYFMETFGIPFVRNLKPHEDYEQIGLKYAYLNDDVLHEMIQSRARWDQGVAEPSWLDSLTATSNEDRFEHARRHPFSELSGVWDQLDDRERAAVQRVIADYNGLCEQVRILARLAERLQQRINELEAERASAPEHEPASKNGE